MATKIGKTENDFIKIGDDSYPRHLGGFIFTTEPDGVKIRPLYSNTPVAEYSFKLHQLTDLEGGDFETLDDLVAHLEQTFGQAQQILQ